MCVCVCVCVDLLSSLFSLLSLSHPLRLSLDTWLLRLPMSAPALLVCANRKRHERTKRYMIGYATLDLDEVALFCVANQSQLLKLKQLQTETIDGSAPAGFIKLLLNV